MESDRTEDILNLASAANIVTTYIPSLSDHNTDASTSSPKKADIFTTTQRVVHQRVGADDRGQ
jgi:hypothetical protein